MVRNASWIGMGTGMMGMIAGVTGRASLDVTANASWMVMRTPSRMGARRMVVRGMRVFWWWHNRWASSCFLLDLFTPRGARVWDYIPSKLGILYGNSAWTPDRQMPSIIETTEIDVFILNIALDMSLANLRLCVLG